MKSRILNILIQLDIFVYSLITFGHAKRGTTISSAAWRMEQEGRLQGKIFRPIIDWLLSPWQALHCKSAWLSDQRRGDKS